VQYPDSVEYLYALGNEIKAAKFGLENIVEALGALGNPQDSLRIVHVAGTNGKGSTCAMIEAAARAAGLRTGLYTSPHLIEPTERIVIEGRPVTREQFAGAFARVHEVGLRMETHPTYFETVTAMAFLLSGHAVELAVVEVGLGGRLDATNVVQPAVCAITPVDFDHEVFLGSSLRQIAGEKAGILRLPCPRSSRHSGRKRKP
jgi:dihydrofolate synthase/folylpolyglutamate synthase